MGDLQWGGTEETNTENKNQWKIRLLHLLLGGKKNPHTMKEIQSNHALGIIFPCCDFKFFLRIQSVCIFPQYSVYLRQSKLFKAFCCCFMSVYKKL